MTKKEFQSHAHLASLGCSFGGHPQGLELDEIARVGRPIRFRGEGFFGVFIRGLASRMASGLRDSSVFSVIDTQLRVERSMNQEGLRRKISGPPRESHRASMLSYGAGGGF
jgi:hypothetical protein